MTRIACIQSNPIFGDISANIEKFEKSVELADADLLVFPELALTGYFYTSAGQARPFAESIEGKSVQKLQLLAKRFKRSIITGFLEENGGLLYNTSIAINCYGNVVGQYRKVHLFYFEKQVFTPGDLGFPVFDLEIRTGEILRIGMLICYDWRFPEAARTLAIKGAEIIAIPSNIVSTTGMLMETLKVRAFENKVIVAFSDRVGSEKSTVKGEEEIVFRGQSAIINYNGNILAECPTNNESIAYAEVFTEDTKVKTINRFNNIILDRQGKTYFGTE